MAYNVSGNRIGSAYEGVNAPFPPNTNVTNVDPTQYDTNFNLLDLWINTDTSIAWILVSLSGNSSSAGPVAVWVPLNGASGGSISEILANSGIPILPNGAGEILALGGANINTVGSTNTLTINLNNSIDLPATTADGSSGVIDIGGITGIQMLGTGNVFLGGAGNFTLTGSNNTLAGLASGELLTTGNNNAFYGAGSGQSLTTGSNSILIGFGSGSDYESNESNNICIGNLGVIADQNTMRLGTSGSGARQIDATYIAGIYNSAEISDTENGVVIVDLNGLVTSSRGDNGEVLIGRTGDGPVWNNITSTGGTIAVTNGSGTINIETVGAGGLQCAFLLQNTPNLVNVTGDGSIYFYGSSQALVKSFDVGNNCTTGNGTGTPAIFTAPTTSQYYLEITVDLTNLAADGGADAISGTAEINTTSKTYTWEFSPQALAAADLGVANSTISFQQIVNMSQGDTATFSISTNNNTPPGNKVIGLGANAYIAGHLVSGAAFGILEINADVGGSISAINNEINILGGTNIQTVASGPNTLTINSTGSGGGFVTWGVITTSQIGVAGHGYFCNGGSQVVVTLPTSSAVGDTIAIAAMNSAGFQIAQPAGVSIRFTSSLTTVGVGGSLTSTSVGDGIVLVCNVANTGWQAVPGSMGNITVV